MITLKVDLESTQNYGMSIYKGDDSNFYMFNGDGDLLYRPKKTYGVRMNEVWEFAIGTFKLNEDRIITQTQEYFEKYYVCDKAAYEESLKKVGPETIEFRIEQGNTILILDGKNKPEGVTWLDIGKSCRDYRVVQLCDDEQVGTFEDYNAVDDTDIEEEIQRVLVGLKSTDIYTNTYQALLSTLGILIDIREKI